MGTLSCATWGPRRGDFHAARVINSQGFVPRYPPREALKALKFKVTRANPAPAGRKNYTADGGELIPVKTHSRRTLAKSVYKYATAVSTVESPASLGNDGLIKRPVNAACFVTRCSCLSILTLIVHGKKRFGWISTRFDSNFQISV